MKSPLRPESNLLLLSPRSEKGSVLLVTMGIVAILMILVGVTLLSTTNKYFTAYQWASWQEALQGAESGADIAMGELRKDISGSASTAWVGWKIGTYSIVNGKKVKDSVSEQNQKTIDSSGNYPDNSGGGSGHSTKFTARSYFTSDGAKSGDYLTYRTQLSSHDGEGNKNLRITTTIDAPTSLANNGVQWLRVRSTGSTDLAGPVRVSEERLDNRLRKLGLFFDKVLNQSVNTPVATRQIELVAKPVSLFAGALMAMVQYKDDGGATVTDSFNSEDNTNWPTIKDINNLDVIDMSISHNPASPLGKNGDIASNAFPIKHDHSENLDIKGDTIWGDVGNNYSQIKGIDPAYYGNSPNPANYGLNNGNYGFTNPTPNLIKTDASADVSGNISTNYYRDLPAIKNPTWTGATAPDVFYNNINNNQSVDNTSTDPNNPTRVQIGTTSARGSITLNGSEKFTLKAAAKPGGWTVNTPTIHRYVTIWVTGDIKLDDGGTIVLEQKVDGATGKVISDVTATIYFDRNMKIGEAKETKTNNGGFDNQSDDAKNLILLGVTEPDAAQKLPKDSYIDPLGNESLYTPYKATGNILLKDNDFTGAIYAPDHNIVFDNLKDGKGKRKKRKQDGNEFYGSYVGRTINSKKAHNYHFDESLNDAGPVLDWGYVSWFEDVDVDHR